MEKALEFIKTIVANVIDSWFTEFKKVWSELLKKLGEIWSFRWGDLLWLAFPIGAPGALVPRLLDSMEALAEFGQDSALIWQRIVVDVADDAIPVPDSWKGRVVRADQMLRFFVQETLRFGVNIQDLDPPPELDMTKIVEKYVQIDKLVSQVREGSSEAIQTARAGLRATIIFRLTVAVGNILKVLAAVVLAAFAGWIIWRAHDEEFSSRVLRERALPQDSKRVRSSRPVGQHRVNQRTGPDQ